LHIGKKSNERQDILEQLRLHSLDVFPVIIYNAVGLLRKIRIQISSIATVLLNYKQIALE
jgi:hypothetical protein